jgi:DNA-binding MarR family transcriptional regulator
METLQELHSTLKNLERDRAGLRADQLMDEVLWDTLNLLTLPQPAGLERWASATGDLAKELLSRAEPGPATWRVWYAGQLQAVTGLIRSLLGRRLALSTSAMLRQKNKLAILSALGKKDLNISVLAQQLDLDDSQAIREIQELVRHQLVETAKVGRERWVRITLQGRLALAEIEAASATERILENTNQAVSLVGEEELGKLFPSLNVAFVLPQIRQPGLMAVH